MARTTTTTDTQTVTVEHIDPRTLLVDANVRHDTRVTKDFVASLKEHGVLQPIVAVRTTDGTPRVRFGHRRTLAAIEAGLGTVPVLVAADEANDDAATIERLVQQWAENEHRDGLTTAERVDVAAQLSLLGVSAAQIAKRTRMPRAQVTAALTVAGSDLAKTATARYDFLDLTQAAVVAEFEDDHEMVKALVAAAETGQFDHVAQRARDARATAARRAAFAQAMREQDGITVLDDATCTVSLGALTDGAGAVLTVEGHADCPGHAAVIGTGYGWVDPTTGQPPTDDETSPDDTDDDEDGSTETVWASYPRADFVCTDFAAHGHERRARDFGDDGGQRTKLLADLPPAEQEARRAERRDVIESNKAWKSAEVVRREWIGTLLSRRTAPKGTIGFLVAALAHGDHPIRQAMEQGHPRGRALLGLDAKAVGWHTGTHQVLDALADATDARAQVIALGLLLGAYEEATGTHSWRQVTAATTRYLTFLNEHGYALAEVERRACGQDPLPQQAEDGHGDPAGTAAEATPQ